MPDDDLQARERLPAAVNDLAMRLGVMRLGVEPDAVPSSARLAQTGRMKRKLGTAAWMSFTAIQTISTRACEFEWQARFGPFGALSVCDGLKDGEGRLDIKALGFIPLAHTERSPALLRGELMRYLAELAWAPDAILGNPKLRWRVERPDRLVVGAGHGETAAEVVLDLDDEGRIAGALAPDRPRSATAPVLPTPWRGRYSDYRHHNGVWIPFAGEVAWEIEGKQEVYWHGRIETWASH